jgi:hypothetical protein
MRLSASVRRQAALVGRDELAQPCLFKASSSESQHGRLAVSRHIPFCFTARTRGIDVVSNSSQALP